MGQREENRLLGLSSGGGACLGSAAAVAAIAMASAFGGEGWTTVAAAVAGAVVAFGAGRLAGARVASQEAQRLADNEDLSGAHHFECTPALAVRSISKGIDILVGRPAREFVGRPLAEFLAALPIEGDLDDMLADAGAGRPARAVRTLERPAGEPAAVELVLEPVRDARGAVVRLRGLLRNVTADRRTLDEAMGAQSRLREALDSLPDGFLLFDSEDRLVSTNRTLATIYPVLAKHAVIGRTYEEMMRLSWRDGGQSVGDVEGEAYIRMRLASHHQPQEPLLRRLRDGRWVEIVDRRTRNGGVVTRIVDMTARRQAEAEIETARRRLAEAIDHMHNGFALFGPDDRLVVCNQHFRDMLEGVEDVVAPGVGYETILRVGVARSAYGPGRDSEAWIGERLAQHVAGADVEFERLTPSGRWIRAMDRRTPSGHIVCLRTDISAFREIQAQLEGRVRELEEAQEAMARQKEELQRLAEAMTRARDQATKARDQADSANRAKTDFLAMMSHELRTPLNAILGFSELMRTECMGPLGAPQYRDYCTDIYNSGVHLLSLINDLLDLAKVESGVAQLKEADVPVQTLVEASVRMIRERAAAAGLRLVERVGPDLPLLRADERRVVQILVNLLSNAVKFTPAGGSVVVSADRDDYGGVVIAVADTGIGIPEDALDLVMEPFFQAEGMLSRQHEGTGLGLPLARQLAEAHGATLTLASTEGEGTTATLRFPPERALYRSAVQPQRAVS